MGTPALQLLRRAFAAAGLCVAAALGAGAASAQEPQPLTLAEALQTALRHEATPAIAERQLEQAQSALVAARSSYWPAALGDWRYTFTESSGGRRFTTLGGIPVGVGGSQERHQSTLAASYTLLDSGLRRARLSEAHANVAGAGAALGGARAALTFRVAAGYFDLLREQRALQLAEERVAQAEARLELVQARIDAGLAAQVDRYPLEAELAQARLSQVTAGNLLRQASIALRAAMGLEPGPLLQPQEPVAAPPVAELPSLAEAIAAALRLRPDLLEVQAAVGSARARLDQSTITARPVLSVNTSYVWKVEPAPAGRDLVLDAQATFPLFDAGARRAQRAAAQAALDAGELRVTQARKEVAAQIEQALVAATTAWERIHAAAVGVEAARQALESATGRYQAGFAIAIEITDAQVSYYNAQLEAATARYDYFRALARLRNAVGLPIHDLGDLSGPALLLP